MKIIRTIAVLAAVPVAFTIGYGGARASIDSSNPDVVELNQVINPAMSDQAQADLQEKFTEVQQDPAPDTSTAAVTAKQNAPTSFGDLPWAAAARDEESHWTPDHGIIASNQAPYPIGSFAGMNYWSGTVGQTQYQVYAGSRGLGNPNVGAVLIFSAPAGGQLTGPPQVVTPGGTGPLKIVAVEGSQLTLTDTSDGAQHVLDVGTGTLS